MGDHYCCSRCNLRYDKCTCSKDIQKAAQHVRRFEAAKGTEVVWGGPKTGPKVMLQVDIAGDIIDIHKVVGVRTDIPTLFTIEKMKDGGNRLTYNQIRIPDLTKVSGLIFIRQEQ